MPYTRCPACATGFRISASQLSTAGGQVRCGRCGARFDALEALSDDPSELPPPPTRQQDYPPEPSAEQQTPNAPQSHISEVPDLSALLQEAEPQGYQPEPQEEQQTPSTPQSDSSEVPELGALLREAELIEPKPEDAERAPLPFPEGLPDFAASYPDYEAQPDTAKPRLGALIAKGLSIPALILLLGLQLAWFEREQLVSSPQGRALLSGLCVVAGCEPPPRRDLGRFEIISRAILPQEQQPGVLHLGLVFVNQADFPQPYPRVRVSLLSPQGEPTARRTFSPGEYLAPGTRQNGLVQSREPVRVSMELVDPDTIWAGYRFDFL